MTKQVSIDGMEPKSEGERLSELDLALATERLFDTIEAEVDAELAE